MATARGNLIIVGWKRMTSHIFILMPADVPSGPVKGGYALANSLVAFARVTVVTLKYGSKVNAGIDPRVGLICLADHASTLFGKLNFYKSLLLEAGGRTHVASVSLCFSADCLNAFCAPYATTYASVRGNLFVNYRHDYGLLGLALALVHFRVIKRIENVIAMNSAMAQQIHEFTDRKPYIIPNFIDETQYVGQESGLPKSGDYRFLFLGSLTSRKQPVLIVRALKALKDRGFKATVKFLGAGPESKSIIKLGDHLGLNDCIAICGFDDRPESAIVQSDALVLPSLSEGVSRAAMEALYLGVACVLRDVDGNSELIRNGENGATFSDDRELADAMLQAAEISRSAELRRCLLPAEFRQNFATKKYADLFGLSYDR
jgi:glycosyltransferase involved in cell wall biosynthesis